MKASILIANYNNEIFVEDCINSLLHQTYKNIEIIFFDDKSSDSSLDKVKNYDKINLVINTKEKKEFGCYNQINSYREAFNKSSGDVIFFLDSDDYFKENKIEEIIKIFQQNPNFKVIFDLPTYKYKKKETVKKNNFYFYKNYWPYIPPQSCIAISRKYLNDVFDLIDFDSFPQIWMDFRIGIISKYILNEFNILNKSYTFYRQSDKNISSNYKFLSKNWWNRRMEAHEYIIHFFKKNNIKHKKNADYFITYLINKFL